MQVLPLPRRALSFAALLAPTALLLSAASNPARAQQTAPPITMTLDSPLARAVSGSTFSDIDGDPRSDNALNLNGGRAKPLSIVARFGRWFPVAVNLTNSGPAADVTLSMRLASSDEAAMGSVSTFETHVELPTGARKRVWMYGRLERGGCDEGQISLVGRGVSSLSRSFALASPAAGERVVWTISDSSSDGKLDFLSRLPQLIARPDSAQNRQADASGIPRSNNASAVEALSAGHEMVPSRWIGLDGVDLVVLHDFAHAALSTEQQDALRGYVAAGGTMLVLGGSNSARLAASPLRDLWPVAPTASHSTRTAELSLFRTTMYVELARAWTEALKKAAPVWRNGRLVKLSPSSLKPHLFSAVNKMIDAPLVTSTSALAPNARPFITGLSPRLAAVHSYGAGRVEWLAFDPTQAPFVTWGVQEALWKPILSSLGQVRRIEGVDAQLETSRGTSANEYSYSYSSGAQTQDSILASLRAALSRSPQLRTPAASSIAWFLALYVFFLVPVNYVVLRSVDRRELAWITVPVIVLAFSSLSYAAAVRIKGTELRDREVALVQGSDASPLARADSMLWVFSPRKASYSVTGRDSKGDADPTMASAVYADGRRSDVLDSSLVRQDDRAGLAVDGAPINMWDYKSFVGHSVVPSSHGFALEQSAGQRFVVNNSGQALRAASWIEKGQATLLGDMAPGARVELKADKRFAAVTSSWLAGTAAGVYNFDNAGTGRDIASAALAVASVDTSHHADGVYPAPTLVAWQSRPSTALELEGEAPVREAVTLWVWRFTK